MNRRRPLSAREERMWQRVTKSVRRLEARHPETNTQDETPDTSTDDKKRADTVSRENHHPLKPYERPKASRDDLEKLLSGHTSPKIQARLSKSPNMAPKPVTQTGPADRGRERRIRRGKFDIGPSLDLHGHTQDTARASLISFVQHHRKQGESSILVITGKGRGGSGILRARFLEWIAEGALRQHVSGFARANQKHGGDGAFYLFLKRPKA